MDMFKYYLKAFILLGVSSILIHRISFTFWDMLCESIAQKFRAKYLESFIKMKQQCIKEQNLFEASGLCKGHSKETESVSDE